MITDYYGDGNRYRGVTSTSGKTRTIVIAGNAVLYDNANDREDADHKRKEPKTMSKDTRNYYERELDLIDFNGKHPAKILIGSEGKTTKTLDINRESAVALIHRLTEFLLTPDPKEESAAPLDVPPTRPYLTYKTGRDTNGNRIVKVSGPEGSFSIQTLGNLPITHRDGGGATHATDTEVCAYVAAHGTTRQKRILGI